MAIEQSRMKGRGGGPRARLVAGAAIALASSLLLTFENAADLRFFGRVPFAMDLWLAMRAPPPTLLKLPCDQMAAVFDAVVRSVDAEQSVDAQQAGHGLDKRPLTQTIR